MSSYEIKPTVLTCTDRPCRAAAIRDSRHTPVLRYPVWAKVLSEQYLYNLAACWVQLQDSPLPSLFYVTEYACVVCKSTTILAKQG